MADLDITIRRKNGAGYDVLHPTTIISQVTGLQTALDAKVDESREGQANGIATLDANSKIPVSQLPSSIIGGLKFAGSFTTGSPSTPLDLATFITGTVTTGYTITAQLDSISGLTYPAYDATAVQYIGYYWIATNGSQIEDETTGIGDWRGTPAAFDDGINPVDSGGGIVTQGLNLEAGDWLIITGYDSTNKIFFFNVINNTYAAATSAVAGVTTLSDGNGGLLTALAGNTVITEGNLIGLTYTAGTDLNGITSDKLARANHTHSQYLGASSSAVSAAKWATARTITLGGDLSGSVSIDGSANVTLTAAVVDGSHNHTLANITDVTATATELNVLDGIPGTLTATELGYVDGVTSSIQTQLNAKANLAGPTFTGTVVLPSTTSIGTITSTELGYVDGVTSSIQTQLNAKQATITGGATTIASANLTASRALASDSSGKVAVSAVTSVELGYVSGVTSAIQTQLNGKAATVHTHDDRYYTETEVDTLLTNRPEIYYNAVGNSDGDIILDLDSDGAIS
jgi:hypothetical protein